MQPIVAEQQLAARLGPAITGKRLRPLEPDTTRRRVGRVLVSKKR